MVQQTVTLAPGESNVVTFEVIPIVAKTYSVSVDGLTGSFRAITAPVADIRVENLRIVPTQVIINHLLKIYVDVHNYSSFTGQRTITLTVTGRAPIERVVTLNPGQVYTEIYGLSVEAPGIYQVSVDGLWGNFIATAT